MIGDFYLTQSELNALPEYSESMPTGTTIGKQWKRRGEGESWFIGEYAEREGADVLLKWYRARVVTTEMREASGARGLNADNRTSGEIPVYIESLGGSLIDSARISVMAALAMLPPPAAPLIVIPGTEEEMAEDSAGSVHGCLEQAMEWLDAARAHAIGELAAKGAPPTSLHAIATGRSR